MALQCFCSLAYERVGRHWHQRSEEGKHGSCEPLEGPVYQTVVDFDHEEKFDESTGKFQRSPSSFLVLGEQGLETFLVDEKSKTSSLN